MRQRPLRWDVEAVVDRISADRQYAAPIPAQAVSGQEVEKDNCRLVPDPCRFAQWWRLGVTWLQCGQSRNLAKASQWEVDDIEASHTINFGRVSEVACMQNLLMIPTWAVAPARPSSIYIVTCGLLTS